MIKLTNIRGKVDRIIEMYNGDRGQIVSILQDIQEEYLYLPRKALEYVSERLNIPLSHLYSVATFYRAMRLKPRGKYLIRVCLGTACHIRGGPLILQRIERELGIKAGDTSSDMKFTVETVNCVGACALGPIVICNDELRSHMTTVKALSLIKKLKKD